MSRNTVRRALALTGFGALIAAAVTIAPAHSQPGQCAYGNGGFGGGGFCDGPAAADGTWMHCETVYVLGIGGTNCFRVRPVGLDIDPRGWVPA